MTIQELEHSIELYGNYLYSFCLHLTNKRELAEDLYQDIWLYACKNKECINSDGNIKSYLLSVAIHRFHNQKRKAAWRKRIASEEEYLEETVRGQLQEKEQEFREEGLKNYLNQERTAAVKNAVAKLKEKYRIPILLYYIEEMSLQEIALTMQIPVGTVKSRLNYAKKSLKKELEDYINE